MTELEQAREFFAKDMYASKATGVVIDAVGDHYAKCSLKITDIHMNAVGHVMGGVMYTLADYVFAIATNRTPGMVTVTTVSQISYYNVAKGDTLIGESQVIKEGKRNCFYEITITDNLGTLVAKVAVTGTHLEV